MYYGRRGGRGGRKNFWEGIYFRWLVVLNTRTSVQSLHFVIDMITTVLSGWTLAERHINLGLNSTRNTFHAKFYVYKTWNYWKQLLNNWQNYWTISYFMWNFCVNKQCLINILTRWVKELPSLNNSTILSNYPLFDEIWLTAGKRKFFCPEG